MLYETSRAAITHILMSLSLNMLPAHLESVGTCIVHLDFNTVQLSTGPYLPISRGPNFGSISNQK